MVQPTGIRPTAATPPQSAPVNTLPDGLQIRDDAVGTGAEAHDGDVVTVKYTGSLTNGTVFDSTDQHGGKPFQFQLGVGKVIKGWDEGVAGMKIGGKRHLEIPAALAYGDHAVGTIPPNSTLDFDVELLNAQTPPKPGPVVTLPDGLKMQDVQVGQGAPAKDGDMVWVEYIGRFANGAEFDGSDRHGGATFHFQLGKGQVIKGWDEGLSGMQPGGIRRIAVPPSLGYGDHQMGPIPPNSTLFFDIALVKTATPPPPQPAAAATPQAPPQPAAPATPQAPPKT